MNNFDTIKEKINATFQENKKYQINRDINLALQALERN